MQDVREVLALYLKDNGIKQVYVAEKSGLTEAKLGAVLSLKRKLEVNEFFSICDALGVTPSMIRRYHTDRQNRSA